MNLLPPLMKAAFKKNKPRLFDSALLPSCDIHVEYALPKLNAEHCRKFHEVVRWQDSPNRMLHPCYLHTQVFKQHMQLMLNSRFPFALLGLVHKSNTIQQLAPLTANANGVLSSKIDRFVRQPKGISCVISSQLTNQQEILWCSEGEFLCIDKKAVRGTKTDKVIDADTDCQVQNNCLCDKGLGRKYARASGDFNPIHLSAFSAKLFGFKRAIAHGMWTKARCISQLQRHLTEPKAVTYNVGFKQPLFLPTEVVFSASEQSAVRQDLQFKVTSDNNKFTHLRGELLFEDGPIKQ